MLFLDCRSGIDSALVAAIAVDALGADAVHAIMMPSAYTSQESLDDATELASALGIRLDTVPITPAMAALDGMLCDQFAGTTRCCRGKYSVSPSGPYPDGYLE